MAAKSIMVGLANGEIVSMTNHRYYQLFKKAAKWLIWLIGNLHKMPCLWQKSTYLDNLLILKSIFEVKHFFYCP